MSIKKGPLTQKNIFDGSFVFTLMKRSKLSASSKIIIWYENFAIKMKNIVIFVHFLG